MKRGLTKLDVREDIRAGREPFSRIMAAVAQLGDQAGFTLIAPFEPAPLYGVLAAQGFTHTARELPDGDWEIQFTHAKAQPAPDASSPAQ